MAKSFTSFIASIAPEMLQVRSEQRITNSRESRGIGFVALIANGSRGLEDYLRESLKIDGVFSRLVELEQQPDISAPLLGLHLPRGKFQLMQDDRLNGQLYGGQIGMWDASEGADRHGFTVRPQAILSESYVAEIIGTSGEYRLHLDFAAIPGTAILRATEDSF